MSADYSGAVTVMQRGGDYCAEAIGSVRDILQGLADAGRALPEMLRQIAEAHGSLVGFLWAIDQRAGLLRLMESWYSPAAPAAANFIETNKTLTFARGRGLPGRVWAGGKASWVTSIAEDADFARAASAAAADLRSAFAFPILTEKGIGGIAEFLVPHLQDRLQAPATFCIVWVCTLAL